MVRGQRADGRGSGGVRPDPVGVGASAAPGSAGVAGLLGLRAGDLRFHGAELLGGALRPFRVDRSDFRALAPGHRHPRRPFPGRGAGRRAPMGGDGPGGGGAGRARGGGGGRRCLAGGAGHPGGGVGACRQRGVDQAPGGGASTPAVGGRRSGRVPALVPARLGALRRGPAASGRARPGGPGLSGGVRFGAGFRPLLLRPRPGRRRHRGLADPGDAGAGHDPGTRAQRRAPGLAPGGGYGPGVAGAGLAPLGEAPVSRSPRGRCGRRRRRGAGTGAGRWRG